MGYQLAPVVPKDEAWLERLRRSVYQELFFATWGSWDEARHLRHCAECWERGGISSVEIDSVRVGMIQLFDDPDGVEIGELQIQPSYQNRGIGTRLLRDTIDRRTSSAEDFLSVALKNDRAYRLYERLGFQKVAQNDTHNLIAYAPQS